MTQKIMAKVREEQEAKKGIWHRVLAFFTMKYPIQALTVLLMAVTAYFIYSSINPAQKYAEEPVGMLAKKEGPPVGRIQEEGKAVREAAPEQKQAPLKPGYKSLDMKYSYEKPAAPVPQEQPAASAPAPEKREAPMSARDEADLGKRELAPKAKAAAPSLMTEQAASSDGVQAHGEAIHPAQAPRVQKDVDADRSATHEHGKLDRTVVQQHPNGRPMTIVTEKVTASGKLVIMKERFDENGGRDGIQEEYYDSGKLKAKVHYDHGKLAWYMEFEEDGVKKLEKSKKDWLWLKKD
jgi:hypothetical protein